MSQSLGRALGLLQQLADRPSTLGQLAEAQQVHKSTVLRLLRTFEQQGFVHRIDEGHYALGPELYRLAQRALDEFDVRALAGPRLRRLRDEVGQTVHLAAFDGQVATYIDKLEPRDAPVRMASRIGNPAMLHCTAVGKVFLAAVPVPERAELVARLELPALTPRTLTGVDELLAEVARVAERGWAQDHAENEVFMNCVAAPVHGPDGRVLAAVSLSVPDVLLDHRGVLDLVPSLLAAAADISRSCGAPGAREVGGGA